jgi:uncharacterized membrane protein YdbT with pleckstrin-like domain
MGFPAKLLGPGERLVLLLRPHVKALIVPVIVLLVTAPATALLAGLVPEGGMQTPMRWALVVVELLVLARWVVWPFLVWWNTIYAITDRRLVLRSGVFNRSGHDMPLSRLNDVRFSHTVIERVLGCGTLVVESAGESGQLVLDDVPRVEQVQRALYRLSDDVRDRSGRREPAVREEGAYDAREDDGDDGDDGNPTRVLGRRRGRDLS